MIEKLTKAKLIEYGFDKTSIERLLKWSNYECLFGNERGYFFASNIEGKIYSGKEGREKHFPPLRAKDKFETFENLFDYVYSLGLIESDKENRKFYREAQKSSHRLNFNIWLQTCKGWEYGNETQYKENLTKQNWIEYIEFWKDEIKRKKADLEKEKQSWKPQQAETKTEQEAENDFTLSTIENWLFEFKEKMSETDYQNLVSALMKYFEIGIFPTLSKPIQINGRPNKKLFGWALNRIFEAKGKGVEKELLKFAKQNISIFTDVKFDETNILKSNLYKYFTTKTK